MKPIAQSRVAWKRAARMRRGTSLCTATCVATLALVACAPMSREQGETRAGIDVRSEVEAAADAAGSETMPLIDEIRLDAAQRAGVPVDQVKVLSVEAVTWSDGSLGCPEPGMMYTQALVPGHRVRVEAAGATLLYHAGPQSTFVHCPPERAKPPSALDPT